MLSTVFDKNCFHVAKLKKCQDKISQLATSSVRHLIQEENGTFSQALLTMSVRSDNVESLGVVLYDNDIANGVQR